MRTTTTAQLVLGSLANRLAPEHPAALRIG